MDQLGQSKSAIATFMRDRKEKSGAGFQDSMLKLVRTLPKVNFLQHLFYFQASLSPEAIQSAR